MVKLVQDRGEPLSLTVKSPLCAPPPAGPQEPWEGEYRGETLELRETVDCQQGPLMMTHSQALPPRGSTPVNFSGCPREHAALAEGQWNFASDKDAHQLTEAGAIAIVSCTVILNRHSLSLQDLHKRCHQ